jgi:hypothetical protein
MGKEITDRIAREENEADKKAMKKILGAAAAVPAGLAGLAASANKDFPGPIDSARISGKMAYNTVTGDKKALAENEREFSDAVKRSKDKKPARESSGTTNDYGDPYKKGGMVSSASKRADGCAQRGKTRGRMV